MIDFSLYDILFQGDFLITLGVLHFMFGFEENLTGTVVSHVGGTCNSSGNVFSLDIKWPQ